MKQIIQTLEAPQAVGPYSQAVKAGMQVFLSGQIALDPKSMQLVNQSIEAEANQVLKNLKAVAEAAGGSLDDIVKLNIYLTDLSNFELVNKIMASYFKEPYPARATIGVAALPKGAAVEMDAIMSLGD